MSDIKSEFESALIEEFGDGVQMGVALWAAKWMAERCATELKELKWSLPLYQSKHDNELSDDVACEVSRQSANEVLSLAKDLE